MYHFFLSIFNKKHDLSFLSNVKNTSIHQTEINPYLLFCLPLYFKKSFYCDFITLIPFIFSTLQIIEKYIPHFYPIIAQTSIKMVWLWYIFWNDNSKEQENVYTDVVWMCQYVTRIFVIPIFKDIITRTRFKTQVFWGLTSKHV